MPDGAAPESAGRGWHDTDILARTAGTPWSSSSGAAAGSFQTVDVELPQLRGAVSSCLSPRAGSSGALATSSGTASGCASSGDSSGFLGPNGAGKTTAMRMPRGLRRRDEGELQLPGHDTGTSLHQALAGVAGPVAA